MEVYLRSVFVGFFGKKLYYNWEKRGGYLHEFVRTYDDKSNQMLSKLRLITTGRIAYRIEKNMGQNNETKKY